MLLFQSNRENRVWSRAASRNRKTFDAVFNKAFLIIMLLPMWLEQQPLNLFLSNIISISVCCIDPLAIILTIKESPCKNSRGSEWQDLILQRPHPSSKEIEV